MKPIFLIPAFLLVTSFMFGQGANPCGATNVSVGADCTYSTYTTVGATPSSESVPSCDMGDFNNDVWFTCVVPASGRIRVQTQANGLWEAGLAIYSGPDCSTLTEEFCECTWTMPGISVPSSAGLAGQTIWIRIWDYTYDIAGTFDMCVFEPEPGIEIDTVTYSHEQLVTEVLVTGCLEASNVTYTGHESSIGYFSADGTPLGFEQGVILSSGRVIDALGPNDNGGAGEDLHMMDPSSGDALLTAVAGMDTYDASILEFDFIPQSNTLEFNFIFASEEYLEYVNAGFNDAFGFFLSGGPEGYINENIALVPGTATPVSIDNVNDVTNPTYYINNGDGTTPGTNQTIQYDGLTVSITATATVTQCSTYHIKLAVADAGDGVLDSGVLLEAGSFTGGGEVDFAHYSMSEENYQVYEGCSNYFVFTRIDTTDLSDTVYIDFMISGTADIGTDLSSFPTNIFIPPGQVSDTIYYSTILDNMVEGTETLVFTVVNGCPCGVTSSELTIEIIDNFDLDPTISNDTAVCDGQPVDLTVNINPLLSSDMYSVEWSTGETTETISVSPSTPTTYEVTISGTCQDDVLLSVDVSITAPLSADFTLSTDSICTNQGVLVNFTGAANPGTNFYWDFDGATPGTANTEGPHTVSWPTFGDHIVTLNLEENGCVGDSTISIYIAEGPEYILSSVDASCFENCDGSVTAAETGGLLPYTYLWDDPASSITSIVNGVCAGDYNVTVTNTTGCSSSQSVTVNEPNELTGTISSVAVLCFGGNDGSASITAQEGTAPYTYLWDAGAGSQATATANNLSAGNYSVTITDNNGCTYSTSVDVLQPLEGITLALTGYDISCFGSTDGSIVTDINGGTTPYSFSWSSGSTDQNPQNLIAGNYSVTATDMNNCSLSDDVTLTEPPQIIHSYTSTDPTCYEEQDGTISVSISGGVSPYEVYWSFGVIGTDLNSVSAGNYAATITDNSGCTEIFNVSINEPDEIFVNVSGNYYICMGESSLISASTTGGTAPYIYTWNTGLSSSTLSVSPTTTTSYSVFVTDANNCTSSTENFTVNVYPEIEMSMAISTDSICPGDPVEVSISVNGGNGGPYLITNEDNNIVSPPYQVYPSESTTITLTANDLCGSPNDSESLNVVVMTVPDVSIDADILSGCEPLTVNFADNSVFENQAYSWDFNDPESYNTSTSCCPEHTFEEDGLYDISLEVTSEFGCVSQLTVPDMIEVYPQPEASFIPDPQSVSILDPVIYFDNISELAHNSYWFFGNGDSSSLYSPEYTYHSVGDYTVILVTESAYGCLDTADIVVYVNSENTFYAPTAIRVNSTPPNNMFFVTGTGISEEGFSMFIYDRWGEKIYETFDYDSENPSQYGWNGRAKKNEYVKTGVYSWIVYYKDIFGNYHEESGYVTVLR